MMRKIALLAAHDVNFHNSGKLLLNLSHTGEMEQYGLVWGRVIVVREIKFLLLFKLLRTYLFVVTIIKHINFGTSNLLRIKHLTSKFAIYIFIYNEYF